MMRKFIEIVTEGQRPTYLYHGTWRGNISKMLKEGIRAPSYWGNYEIAENYCDQFGEEGVIIRVPLRSFDEDGLEVNENLISSLTGAGEYVDDDNAPTTWEESLEAVGSVVYQYTMHIDPEDVIE